MEAVQAADTAQIAAVYMRSSDYWIRLSLRIVGEYSSGELVRFADEAAVSVESADELSSTYHTENWMSGVISGALYAFRTLRIPRKRLVLEGLSGRLRSIDMDALANCSATAIATLVEKELPELNLENWTVDSQVDHVSAPLGTARSVELRNLNEKQLCALLKFDETQRSLSDEQLKLIRDILIERGGESEVQLAQPDQA